MKFKLFSATNNDVGQLMAKIKKFCTSFLEIVLTKPSGGQMSAFLDEFSEEIGLSLETSKSLKVLLESIDDLKIVNLQSLKKLAEG